MEVWDAPRMVILFAPLKKLSRTTFEPDDV